MCVYFFTHAFFQEEMNVVCQALCKVHGVGPKTAVAWYKEGVRSVKDAQQRAASGEKTHSCLRAGPDRKSGRILDLGFCDLV